MGQVAFDVFCLKASLTLKHDAGQEVFLVSMTVLDVWTSQGNSFNSQNSFWKQLK